MLSKAAMISFLGGGPFVSPRTQPRGPEEGQRGEWKRLNSTLTSSSPQVRVAFGAFFCFVFCFFGHAPALGAREGRGGSGRGRGRRAEETWSGVAVPAASGQQGAPSLCLKPRFCRLGGLSPQGPRPEEGGGSGEGRKERARERPTGVSHTVGFSESSRSLLGAA